MEKKDRAGNISREKGLTETLRKRARDHARDVGLDDTIHTNRVNGLENQVRTAFLNEKGERRRRIDDL